MSSVTDIYNRALQKLGVKAVTSPSENSNAARACNRCYDILRRAELEDHRWNFAIERATIAADATAPEWGRANAFTLPSQGLKVIPPYPEMDSPWRDWVIEGRKILTNDTSPLYLRYIRDVIVVNEMSALFIEALASKMAEEMCEELTQSNTKIQNAQASYKKAISRAKKSNAIQNIPQQAVEDTWVAVRVGGTRNDISGY